MAPDLIYSILLPPLIFEAALQLKWRPFRRDLPVTVLLAFPGVALTGAIIAAGMHYGVGWGWLGAALFGALIAATDPVSVVAAFRELRVEPRLSLLVESESLLNDGTAAVAFAMLVSVAHGAPLEAGGLVASLGWMVIGGVLVGVAAALAALTVAGRTDDHLVEITLTTPPPMAPSGSRSISTCPASWPRWPRVWWWAMPVGRAGSAARSRRRDRPT